MNGKTNARGFSYYDQFVETLDPASLHELQNRKLRTLIEEISPNRFYQEKARAGGIELAEIKTVDDLQRLPLTAKSDLVWDQQGNPPFGRIMTYPVSRYSHFHQTSGTTGKPLKCLDTLESWDWWARSWGYVYKAAGVTSSDVIFLAFSFGPYISHWVAISGAWHIGALAVSGGGMNSEQRLRTIIETNCTVIVCTPTYALRLAEVAQDNGIDLRNSAVRIGIHAGEPGASLPNVRSAIERSWGALSFDHAGATEAGAWGFDCEARAGAIHLNEAEFVFDVIDPVSLLPVADGVRGELVITSLGRACMPALRYRTGDLVERTAEPCQCGRTFARIKGGVLGRADDMMIVRGVNLYPAAVDDLIRGVDPVVEYEVDVRRVEGMDDLLVKIEVLDGASPEEVRRALIEGFKRQFNIRVAAEVVPPGSLPRYELKARRFKRINR
ncbi:MAG TPA: AMP-binding protein [Blastocatellia bacterium]|nr:AMP-binding protein [Blastocatellia bacterium]